jgi:hypothetical protein
MPAAALDSAACAVDPAFALIAAHRAAEVAHIEVIEDQDEAETKYGIRSDEAYEARDRCGAACDEVNAICWKLATIPPTTLAGVAAVLRFANEVEDAGNEWPDTDAIGPDGWHYELRATMAAALESRRSFARRRCAHEEGQHDQEAIPRNDRQAHRYSSAQCRIPQAKARGPP